MPDYISWYVVELRQHLAGRLSPIRIEEICAEVESHLRERSADLLANYYMAEDQAAKVAIDAFGMPHKIALDHLTMEGRKPLGLEPKWLVLGGALVAIACWDFHWASLGGLWDNFGETWQNGVAGIVGFAAIVVFLVGCRAGYRSYRWQITALFGGVAAGLPLLLSAWMISVPGQWQGISRFHVARDSANVRRNVAKIGHLQKFLEEGITAFATTWGGTTVLAANKTGAVTAERVDVVADGQGILINPQPFITLPSKFVVTGNHSNREISDETSDGLPLVSRPHSFDGTRSQGYVVPYSNGVFSMVDGRLYGLDVEYDLTKAATRWHNDAHSSIASAKKQVDDDKRLLAAVAEAQQGRIFFFNPAAFSEPVGWTIVLLPLFLIADGLMFALGKWRRYRRGMALA